MGAFTAESLRRLVEPLVAAERVRLCEVAVTGNPRRRLVQVYVDTEEGGISVETCATLSRLIQEVLDARDDAPPDYRLIVSSPGLDRPLRELWQFRKNLGRRLRAVVRETPVFGRITEVHDDGTVVLDCGGDSVAFSIAEFTEARVEPDLGKIAMKSRRKRNEKRNR